MTAPVWLAGRRPVHLDAHSIPGRPVDRSLVAVTAYRARPPGHPPGTSKNPRSHRSRAKPQKRRICRGRRCVRCVEDTVGMRTNRIQNASRLESHQGTESTPQRGIRNSDGADQHSRSPRLSPRSPGNPLHGGVASALAPMAELVDAPHSKCGSLGSVRSTRTGGIDEPAHSHASTLLLVAALVLIGWLLVVSSADAREALGAGPDRRPSIRPDLAASGSDFAESGGAAQTLGKGRGIRWKSTTATWYGGKFFGNGTACGQTYTPRIRGVAIGHVNGRWLARCGDTFVIRYRNEAVRVRVIDRCPGCVGDGHRFDLSARTAMDLCDCWQPYTMRVKWRAVR